MMKPSQSGGFTLIELVVVITILGILAAFAIPKFIALDSQARAATISGLAGSVNSAAALARSMSMASSLSSVRAKSCPQNWGKEGKHIEPSTPLALMSRTRSWTS